MYDLGARYADTETDEGLQMAVNMHARYVRVFSSGNTANPGVHFIEIEVWGCKAEPRVSPDSTSMKIYQCLCA